MALDDFFSGLFGGVSSQLQDKMKRDADAEEEQRREARAQRLQELADKRWADHERATLATRAPDRRVETAPDGKGGYVQRTYEGRGAIDENGKGSYTETMTGEQGYTPKQKGHRKEVKGDQERDVAVDEFGNEKPGEWSPRWRGASGKGSGATPKSDKPMSPTEQRLAEDAERKRARADILAESGRSPEDKDARLTPDEYNDAKLRARHAMIDRGVDPSTGAQIPPDDVRRKQTAGPAFQMGADGHMVGSTGVGSKSKAPGSDKSNPVQVTTPADVAKLPPGTWVRFPDGTVRPK